MNERHDDETIQERAALYSLGSLSPDEARVFEQHLETCAVCMAEVEGFRGVTYELGHAAPPVSAEAGLREKVLGRIAAEDAFRDTTMVETGGIRFVRGGDLDWVPAGLPGIQVKPLFADAEADRTTHLVWMEPGATYPGHRHAEVEEIFVLEGDLMLSGVLMRAGDYCRAEPESVHGRIRSPNGCICIVTASRSDELLPEAD